MQAVDVINLFEAKLNPCAVGSRGYYDGEPLETGGTSIQGKASPGVKWLFNKGNIKASNTVLDYGAGKYGRNGIFLREQGCKVFCYDPFNGSDKDGWKGVSQTLPNEKFDVAFSCFVLNVVPYGIEQQIVRQVSEKAKRSFHITRNTDIFDSIKKALKRKDKLVGAFFVENFAHPIEIDQYENGTLDDDVILEFCVYGVQTSRGFQRIPCLEQQSMNMLRSTSGWKIYEG